MNLLFVNNLGNPPMGSGALDFGNFAARVGDSISLGMKKYDYMIRKRCIHLKKDLFKKTIDDVIKFIDVARNMYITLVISVHFHDSKNTL